jgi:hypothetical protein
MLTDRVVRVSRIGVRAAAGHGSGLRTSIRSAKTMHALRQGSTLAVDTPAQLQADQLRREGYLRQSPGYPAELLTELQHAMAYADDPVTSVGMGGRIKDSVRYVVDPLALIPRMRELLTPELIEILHGWYGTEFRLANARVWRIAHIPPAEQEHHHYGNLWHVDGHELDVMKLFVQISPDASRSGSAFRLLSTPDTRRVFRRGFIDPASTIGFARHILEEKPVYFDGPPGDAAFVDTNRCLHRAGIPEPGHTRGMVQFYFKAASAAPTGGDYFADVPPDKNVYEGAIA